MNKSPFWPDFGSMGSAGSSFSGTRPRSIYTSQFHAQRSQDVVVPIWIRPTSYVHCKAGNKIDFHLLLLYSDFVGCNYISSCNHCFSRILFLMNIKKVRRCKPLDIPGPIYHVSFRSAIWSTKNISPQEKFHCTYSFFPSPKILSWTWQEGEDDDFQIFGVTSLGAIAGSERPSWSDGKGILGSQPSTSFRVSWWQTDCLGIVVDEKERVSVLELCVCFFFGSRIILHVLSICSKYVCPAYVRVYMYLFAMNVWISRICFPIFVHPFFLQVMSNWRGSCFVTITV